MKVNKIVGRGLVATAFKQSLSDSCLFFCSGVSDSSVQEDKEFEREEALLRASLESEHTFVYFSSLYAPRKSNKYYIHKMRMEGIVAEHADSYLIIRLPQVAGVILNNTLFSSFVHNIYQRKYFNVYENSTRTIVDINHVVEIFDLIFRDGCRNEILNICPNYQFKPIDLVSMIADELNIIPNIKILNVGVREEFQRNEKLLKYDHIYGDINNYLNRVVKKYTTSIVQLINSSE